MRIFRTVHEATEHLMNRHEDDQEPVVIASPADPFDDEEAHLEFELFH